MDVPLTELAASFYFDHAAALRPVVLPFALQRLMQGRTLLIRRSSRSKAAQARVLLWAFAIDQPKNFVPIWYSLYRPDGAAQPVRPCPKCWSSEPYLYQHPLYTDAQNFLDAIWSSCFAKVALPALRHLPSRGHGPADIWVKVSPSNRWAWGSRLTVPADCSSNRHVMYCTAILDLALPGGMPRDALARSLQRAVDACCKILSGREMNPGGRTVLVQHRLPGSVKNQLETGDPGGSPEQRAVSRLLRHARLLARDGQHWDPLYILLIRRCAENPSQTRARARFVFAAEQEEAIQARLKQLSQGDGLVKEVINRALELAKAGDEWGKIQAGLEELGFPQEALRSAAELENYLQHNGRNLQLSGDMRKKLFSSLKHTFPVDTVVSNRIMGHGCPEWVPKLWASPGLIQNLGDYNRAQLIAEMVVFPKAIGEDLYYVPLRLPPSRSIGHASDFFLCFAVAMCPPRIIDPEDFRELVERHGEDLYLGFLEEIDFQLYRAAGLVVKCQQSAVEYPHAVPEQLHQLAQEVGASILEAVRLADFWVPKPLKWAWQNLGVQWPEVSDDQIRGLRHAEQVRLLSLLSDHLFHAALSPHAYWEQIATRCTLNIDHSGLLFELADIIFRVEQLRNWIPCGMHQDCLSTGLSEVANSLRFLQRRWTLLARRSAGRFEPKLLAEHDCKEILDQAVRLVKHVLESKRKPFPDSDPQVTVNLQQHFVYEDPAALSEIATNLIANIAEHEKPAGEWGLSLTWCDDVTGISGDLNQAFQTWHEHLHRHGVCVMTAYPCTLDRQNLHKWMSLTSERPRMGLWVIRTLTRVYSSHRPPLASVDVCDGHWLVLIPGGKDAAL